MAKILSELTKNKILNYLKNINETLEKKDGSHSHVVSLKILFPKDSSLGYLCSLLFIKNPLNAADYDNLENQFVYDQEHTGPEIKRTLTFLDNQEKINYGIIRRISYTTPAEEVPEITYCITECAEIPINNEDRKKFSDATFLKDYWKKWKESIKKHFKSGEATLWSSLSLKQKDDTDESFVVSAYFIFSKPVKKQNTLIYIDKGINEILVYLILKQHTEEIRNNAVRTALAQVMARNLSHNIGSHVLVKVVNMIKDTIFYNLQIYNQKYRQCLTQQNENEKIPNIDELIKSVSDVFSEISNTLNNIEDCTLKELDNKIEAALKCLKNNYFNGLQDIIALFNYIKVRMDYIADITTSTPVMETSTTLGDIIMEGFLKNRLFVDTISGINDFYYKFEYDDDSKNKILAIPGDVLGNHAFYTILENLIRNLAKHGSVSTATDSPVIIQIKVEDDVPACQECKKDDVNEMLAISVIIKNDITGETKIKKNNNGNDDKTDVWEKSTNGRRHEKISNIDWLVHTQNRQINKSVIDGKTYELRQGGWGLLEMEASAAYLRKIPMEDIENEEYAISLYENETDKKILTETNPYFTKEENGEKRLSIFRAYKATGKEENYLAYRFFISKPHEVLIVGNKEDIFKDGIACDEIEWLKHGIKIISKEKFLEENGIGENDEDKLKTKPLPLKKIYPHRLVVNCTDLDLSNNPCLSKRILVCNKTAKFNCKCDPQTIIDKLWTHYALLPSIKGDLIFIYQDCYRDFELLEKNGNLCWSNYKLRSGEKPSNHGEDYSFKTINYQETYTSNTERYNPWEKDSNNNNILYKQEWEREKSKKIEEICSRSVNVKVIDERIQSQAFQYYSGKSKIKFHTLYRNINIFVPVTSEYETDFRGDAKTRFEEEFKNCHCDLNEQSFSENTYKAIIKFIQNKEYRANEKELIPFNKTDFVVIHLGVLEKMIKTYNECAKLQKKGIKFYDKEKQIKDFVFKEICDKTPEHYDRIVVISGRGEPQNLPDDIRYLNFSIVSQYLIDQRNKFAFTSALYSARKIKNKKTSNN